MAARPVTQRISLFCVSATLLLAILLAGCGSSPSHQAARATSATTLVADARNVSNPNWVIDSVHSLDIFLPDADSTYLIGGYGVAAGARTIIQGTVPEARYWSFTAYTNPASSTFQHVHDSDIAQHHGRYSLTLASSCAGIPGTCLPISTSGLVVMRIYVPADGPGGTGAVAMPSINYRGATGEPLNLIQASASTTSATQLATLRALRGAPPKALTQHYAAPAPVPVPVEEPPPTDLYKVGVAGLYPNPDNVYRSLTYTTTRGDFVVSATAPSYRSNSPHPANDLARRSNAPAQVRYWSLCVDLKGNHTETCLRDEQIHLETGTARFKVILAPACPVRGYANCLPAGPEPLQDTVAARNLLPTAAFMPVALRGKYSLHWTYVPRPA